MMAAAAKYRDDMGGGGNITGGSASAYTLTSQQVFDSLANADGKAVSFIPHATNAAGATLNVDGLGAKGILFNNAAVSAGVLIANSRYTAVYNSRWAPAEAPRPIRSPPDRCRRTATASLIRPTRTAARLAVSARTMRIPSRGVARLAASAQITNTRLLEGVRRAGPRINSALPAIWLARSPQ